MGIWSRNFRIVTMGFTKIAINYPHLQLPSSRALQSTNRGIGSDAISQAAKTCLNARGQHAEDWQFISYNIADRFHIPLWELKEAEVVGHAGAHWKHIEMLMKLPGWSKFMRDCLL